MKKYLFIFGLLLYLSPSPVLADIYYWVDTEGVMHITDDMNKVPSEYREKISTMETEPAEKAVEKEAVTGKETQKSKTPEQELYGDHPLDWWRLSFNRVRSEIEAANKELEQKEQFISVFKRGRKLGQRNTAKDVETFEKYSVELPLIKNRLDGLKDKLEELQRSARNSGVPKDIRK